LHLETLLKNIIWLASFPKSGNTWTRAFIGSILGYGTISEQGSMSSFSSNCSSRALWPDVFAGREMPDAGMDMAWREQYQTAFSRMLGDARHFCKTHSRYGTVLGNRMFVPEVSAAVVVIVRNPFDVAASMANYFTATTDQGILIASNPLLTFNNNPDGDQNRISVGGWDVNVISWVTQTDIPMLILRYEDMHADPVKHFGRLAREVMGIDDEALIAASAAEADFSNLRKREEKFGFDEAKSKANPFFWKGYPYHSLELFTQKQKDVIWQRHGAVAEAMGYRFEGGKVTLSDIDMSALNGLRKLYESLINAPKIQV
jgi:aryl sulfotransferase